MRKKPLSATRGRRVAGLTAHRHEVAFIGRRTAAAAAAADTYAQPLHAALAEPLTMMQVCHAVRVLGVAFLVLAYLRVVMYERGMMRGMGINSEMTPETE